VASTVIVLFQFRKTICLVEKFVRLLTTTWATIVSLLELAEGVLLLLFSILEASICPVN